MTLTHDLHGAHEVVDTHSAHGAVDPSDPGHTSLATQRTAARVDPSSLPPNPSASPIQRPAAGKPDIHGALGTIDTQSRSDAVDFSDEMAMAASTPMPRASSRRTSARSQAIPDNQSLSAAGTISTEPRATLVPTPSPGPPGSVDLSDRLIRLRAQTERVRSAESSLRNQVVEAVFAGATWSQVAEALGVTKQSAWKRYRSHVNRHIAMKARYVHRPAQMHEALTALLTMSGCDTLDELFAQDGVS